MVSIPNPLDLLPGVSDILGQVGGALTDWVKSYVWNPLRKLFDAMIHVGKETVTAVNAVAAAVETTYGIANGIATSFPVWLSWYLLEAFLDAEEWIVDGVCNYIVKYWADPIIETAAPSAPPKPEGAPK